MKNPIFDDLMQMAGGAMSALTAFKEQLKDEVKEWNSQFLKNANMVEREEFDTEIESLRKMAENAVAEQKKLKKEMELLKKQQDKMSQPHKTKKTH